jgi:hypothetical protein
MSKNAESFLKKTLGEDFLESLGTALFKSEIYKPGSRTITDTNDLYQGLKIVPRALLSLLIRELSPMQIGDTKEVKIPMADDAMIRATKHERDSFSGEVLQRNVKLVDFMHRSIPGLGLVLLSILELYNIEDLDKEHNIDHDQEARIQKIVEDRLQLFSLVNQVVDGKLLQRDAVQQLLMSKLNEMTQEHKQIKEEHKEIKEEAKPTIVVLTPKKKSPLSDFIERRKKKKEHFVDMTKGEARECPDCGKTIFNDSGFSACICYGDVGKVYLKKTEGGFKVSFGRKWDAENIEMLLEVLRSKKNG